MHQNGYLHNDINAHNIIIIPDMENRGKIQVSLIVVVLHQSNSISVISWQLYDVWDEKEKALVYTFADSRDL